MIHLISLFVNYAQNETTQLIDAIRGFNTYRPPPPRPPSRQRQSKPQALFVQPDLAPPDT
jgi:hypothetical protein